jgi:DNA-directed RNA polymerase III subunit RPC6
MWADNDLGDDASQNSSATDSEEVLRKGRRAGKKQAAGGDTTTSSENEDDRPRKKSSKKAQSSRDKRKKRKHDPDDMASSDGGSDGDANVKKRKKQKTDNDRGEDEDGHKLKRIPSTSKRRSGGGSRVSEPDSQSETGSSPSDSNSDEESKPTRLISNSRKSTMSSQPKKRAYARSRSPLASLDDKAFRGAYVYRAVRQERVALGWSEAPCGSCPVFDFCKEGGPVGPGGCEYYGEWLKRATITMDS